MSTGTKTFERPGKPKNTQIKVIGVGGPGGDVVEKVMGGPHRNVEFISVDTSVNDLARRATNVKLSIGGSGLSAARPAKARFAAEDASGAIQQALSGADIVILVAELSGATGAGATPVIASLAKEMGILTIGVVTKPVDFAGPKRMERALAGVAEMKPVVDTLIILEGESLLNTLGDDITQDQFYAQLNIAQASAVTAITQMFNDDNTITADLDEMRTVLTQPGRSVTGTALAEHPGRADHAVELALTSPLMKSADLKQATGLLVLITAARHSLKLSETRDVLIAVREALAPDARVIHGTSFDDALGEQIRVTLIATGLPAEL